MEDELLSVPGHPADRMLSHAEVTRHVTRGPNAFLNANKESNKIVIPTDSGHTEGLLNVKSAKHHMGAGAFFSSLVLLLQSGFEFLG